MTDRAYSLNVFCVRLLAASNLRQLFSDKLPIRPPLTYCPREVHNLAGKILLAILFQQL
jgi:hypothetical protein